MKSAGKFLDLHCHLDGAITKAIARKLAEMQDIDLKVKSDEELEKRLTVDPDCGSLNEFLKCFALPGELTQTPKGLEAAAYLVAQNMHNDGTIYGEIRFAPQLHTRKGMTQEDAIKAVLAGLKRSDLKANLILCCMRADGNKKENLETIELAKKYLVKDGGVVAVDIAGAEALHDIANYADIFAKAREYNIPFTIHAGEADGPESVRKAIELGARRIGHGVRILHDEDVMKLVRDKRIFLEMCPTSNRQTRALEDMSEYPLLDFLKRGIKVTINTDDMGVEGTSISREFEYIRKLLGMTPEQEKQILANSIDAAFTTEEVKDELRKQLL